MTYITMQKKIIFLSIFLLSYTYLYTMHNPHTKYTTQNQIDMENRIDTLTCTIRELVNFNSDQHQTIKNLSPLEKDALSGLVKLIVLKRIDQIRYTGIAKQQKTKKLKQKRKKRTIRKKAGSAKKSKKTTYYYNDKAIKPAADGRYHCGFCNRDYTTFGSLKRHWGIKNHFPE